VDPQRPLVAKIHRDLLLGPQNDPYRTNVLHESWAAALRNLFAIYTPIVIGYGGNDGSLMNFLFTLNPGSIPGGIFWCYKLGGPKPDARIQDLIKRQSGKMLGIPGFDEFMLLVGEELECQTLEKWIVSDANDRAKKYETQLGEVLRQLGESAKRPHQKELAEQIQSAIQSAVPKADKAESWLAWAVKAQLEPDPKKREQIYHEGIQLNPRSAMLHVAFAHFIEEAFRKYDKAEELYRKATELDPENFVLISHLANFLNNVRRSYDEAERLYRKCFERHPQDSGVVANYAQFLDSVRNDKNEAERLYRKAIELDPANKYAVTNYAAFLHESRGDYIEANDLFRRAMEIDPTETAVPTKFTRFLIERGELEEARKLSDRAWALITEGEAKWVVATAMFRGLLLRVANKDDTPALGRLRGLFDRGFLRTPKKYASLFTAVDKGLSKEDRKLYRAIADAIMEEEKVAALDEFPRWKKVDPIPLDEPWPPLAEQD